jgi:7-cyano-7-deazaguanine synthase
MSSLPTEASEPRRPEAALVLFSGGQDSTVCLAWALERYARVETIGFFYGQRHATELEQRGPIREALAETFPDWGTRLGPDHLVDLGGYGAIASSALTEARAIELDRNGLPNTFVPGRNLVFLTVAAALGCRRGLETLVGGMCETDFSGYPDCRRATLDSLEETIALGMDAPVVIQTPLMYLTKAETWGLTHRLGGDPLVEIVRTLTHTCYLGQRDTLHPWGHGCGTCPACELRASGWQVWQAGRVSEMGPA